MDVDRQLVRQSRQARGWTQGQLAEIANLSLRTVQRVENQGVASHETVSSLIVVLEVERDRVLALQPAEAAGALRQSRVLLMSAVLGLGMAVGSTTTIVLMAWMGG